MKPHETGIDFETSLGAVTRSVSELEKEGETLRSVTLERSYNTTAEDLWDAVTNPERLERFFAPVSGELQLGGRYQIEGNADGKITACEPPEFFGATWEFGGGMSWIEVRISRDGEKRSRLSLSHLCPVDEHWEKFGPGAAGVGWDLSLLGLEAHLADIAFDRTDGHALMVSEEGKAFMIGSSKDWGRAAAAFGEDPAQAKAAAEQTTAFYTGEETQEG
ncbi:SRPBCC family protein [Alkalicoccus halolimnae]|uniref:SRPBCC family protein n=1 Tax=Alkalicoccus halolimnae TaxID=1667239 RepID=A0A5C7F7A0_9BACI|nr:SRPBCC family protein [Alkalicoccus halolimnae]TXF85278.1 SRPBCC family protein [Alkalicoccus halolimnae]